MIRPAAAVALLVALCGCGSGPAGSSETPYDFSFDDPPADTVEAVENPDQVKGIDLVRMSGRVDTEVLRIVLEFAEPISRWTDGAANALDGFIYIDIDQSPETGRRSSTQLTGGDFYVDLRDNGSGKVGLVGVVGRTLVLVPAKFEGTRFEVEIKRSDISTQADADDRMNLAVDISARNRTPVVDFAPNEGVATLEPPPDTP